MPAAAARLLNCGGIPASRAACTCCRVGFLSAAPATAAARTASSWRRLHRLLACQPAAVRSAVLAAPVAESARASRGYATAAAKETAGRSGPAKAPSNFTETLCLPKTAFPLREVRSTTEAMRARCTDDLYTWQRSDNSGPDFVLHDGPPFANGDLHIGHALNKILKDITIRYKILRGYKVHYVPGWDCHGLPIEIRALSDIHSAEGKRRKQNVNQGACKQSTLKEMSPTEVRAAAKSLALSTVELQRSGFRSWGIMGDWDNFYITLDPAYEARQLRVFREMVKKGLIYRQLKPVHWSPSSRTALAEAELEYKDDHKSRSVYVKFVVSGTDLPYRNLSLLSWTTTPWTLPANKAVCMNPELNYVIVELATADERPIEHIIMADDLVEKLASDLESESLTLRRVGKINSSMLLNLKYTHPFYDEDAMPVIAASHVNAMSGTGLVHSAPAHGVEDYEALRPLKLNVTSLVNDVGVFAPEAGELLEGKEIHGEGTALIIDHLRAKGLLLCEKPYIHKYPYDWRTKKPVILRATPQWFVSVEGIEGQTLEEWKKVEVIPSTLHPKLEGFVKERSEWCISRQRSWGVPIPVLYNTETGDPLLTDASIDHIIGIVEKQGCDAWWALDDMELVAPQYKANGETYRKGYDTLDVWFDSGTSWTMLPDRGDSRRADMYLEGGDQHRGWFQSSLLTSIAATGRAPFKTILTHGFVLDEAGRKMSKSVGNVVEPERIVRGGKDLAKEPAYGVDVLRAWVAQSDYTKDVHIGSATVEQAAELIRRLRNSLRFMIANLDSFHPSQAVTYEDLTPMDKYLHVQIYDLSTQVTTAYDQLCYVKAVNSLYHFAVTVLSSHFHGMKDSLYADAPGSLTRRAAQTTLFNVLRMYTTAIAPVACHLAEEVYEYFRHITGDPKPSVFQCGWLHMDDRWDNAVIRKDFTTLCSLRDHVNVVLVRVREKRLIGPAPEAQVILHADEAVEGLLQQYESTLPTLFGSSEVVHSPDPPDAGEQFSERVQLKHNGREGICHVTVRRATKHKCPRCWMFHSNAPDKLCSRCCSVVESLGR